jgi:hypothetical protein
MIYQNQLCGFPLCQPRTVAEHSHSKIAIDRIWLRPAEPV